MAGVGVWGMKKTKNLGDFFLGGRMLGPWLSAAAFGTTYFSAVLFIGFAGTQGWQFGLNSLWIALGNGLVGACLAWVVLARRTRKMTQNLDAMTMPEFLQERYGAKHIKSVAAAILFFFLLPYSAGILKGLGHLFETVFSIPYDAALLVIIGFTGVYLILGGYFAVVVTDFIQAFFMFAVAILLVLFITAPHGGIFGILPQIIENYAVNIPKDGSGEIGRPSVITIISLIFMTSFGTWGLPQMTQKFYSIKNETVIPKAAIITTVFALVIAFSAYYTGSSAHVFFDSLTIPRNAHGLIQYDLIVPTLLVNNLPGVLMALILIFILSASMSSLAGLVLVSSSAIVIDMTPVKVHKTASKSNSTALMRVISVVFIIISFFIARFQFTFIVYLMSLSWGVIAGAFAAPYILGLFCKKVTKTGAYAGLLCGAAIMITLFLLLGAKNSPLWASISMIAPFFIVLIVSLFTKKPNREIIDKAFEGV
jgi:SSS family solute:Na+ symporter